MGSLDGGSSPDWKALYLGLVREREEREEFERTSFLRYLQLCHIHLSQPIRVGRTFPSGRGQVPQPSREIYCPTRLLPWTDCPRLQQGVHDSVCKHLQATAKNAPQIFTCPHIIKHDGHRVRAPLASERAMALYERIAVEDHVCEITEQLYKIPEARQEFHIGNGIRSWSHANTLEGNMTLNPYPDQDCMHRMDETDSLLMNFKSIPPNELTVESLRVGLRATKFWEEVVQREEVPTDPGEKLKYNAEQLTGSALTQEYHAMIREGLEYSYLSIGAARVLLWVPYQDPSTLYYYLCEPNMEINSDDDRSFQQPKSTVSRVLCLILMSSLSTIRDHAWRNCTMAKLHTWITSFDYVRSQIPDEELQQTPPGSEYTGSNASSEPPSPLHLECTHKSNDDQIQKHAAPFCTQKCLLGLQQKGTLDERCPNVDLHRQNQNSSEHLINAKQLVSLLKQQLDEDLDHNITPYHYGEYATMLKITSFLYGYTVLGKGTTSRLWEKVSREAEIYGVLKQAQSTAVPVFLGTIDLHNSYFLHRCGAINHILLMGWGGENLNDEQTKELQHAIKRTRKKVRSLGVIHGNFSHETMLWDTDLLWNPELQRVLAIDFHRSVLDSRPKEKRVGGNKKRNHGGQVIRSGHDLPLTSSIMQHVQRTKRHEMRED